MARKEMTNLNTITDEMFDAFYASYVAPRAAKQIKEMLNETLRELRIAPIDDLVSREYAKEKLGVSYPTLHRLINKGELKAVKMGSSTKISSNSLEELIEKGWQRYGRI